MIDPICMESLEIYPLRIRFSFDSNVKIPQHLGSAWRGAFGHHLKKIVCMFKHGSCAHCPLLTSCAYTMIFESEHCFDSNETHLGSVPSPYVLYPVIKNSEMHLYVTLIGKQAAGFFPFILHAFRLAGEGEVAHTTFDYEGVDFFDGDAWNMLQGSPLPLSNIPVPNIQGLSIRMHVPIRFKYQGHLVTPDSLNLILWLSALHRRLLSLATCWGDEQLMQKMCNISVDEQWQTSDIRWLDIQRYSSRQKTAMKMGGIVGTFTLSAKQVQTLWPLLYLGQWLHVGKLTTMGLGKYDMVALEGGE